MCPNSPKTKNAVKISAPEQRKSASRLFAMEFFRCADSLPVQLNTILAILVVRGAARVGRDYSHLPAALLEKRAGLSFQTGPRVGQRWTVGELVKSVRLNSHRADPTTLAIATVLGRCTEVQQFFENCYVLCMLQTVRAAKAMLRTGHESHELTR